MATRGKNLRKRHLGRFVQVTSPSGIFSSVGYIDRADYTRLQGCTSFKLSVRNSLTRRIFKDDKITFLKKDDYYGYAR